MGWSFPSGLTHSETTSQPPGAIQVAGPESIDLCNLARRIADRDGAPRWVIGINFGGPAIRRGGLLPTGEVITTVTTAETWLADST